jgi:hypothetical protein
MLVYIDKNNQKVRTFGSIKALCFSLGLKVDNFYTHFGRKGKLEFENDSYRIVKTEVERS